MINRGTPEDDVREMLDSIIAIGIEECGGAIPVVYSFYDGEGRLLYIGATSGLRNRWDWHHRQDYFDAIAKVGVKIYDSLEKMRLAEIADILARRPLLNKDGIKGMDREVPFSVPYKGPQYEDDTPEAVFTPEEMDEMLFGLNVEEELGSWAPRKAAVRVLSPTEVQKREQTKILYIEDRDWCVMKGVLEFRKRTEWSFWTWPRNRKATIDNRGEHIFQRSEYGKTWRCWSAEPTDEQREAEPWDD